MKFLKAHLFKVLGYVFFLFNSIGLPTPLLYTNVISILGIKSHFTKEARKVLGVFVLLSAIYLTIHFLTGVDVIEYVKSLVFMYLMVFTALVSFNYIKQESHQLEQLFENIAYITFTLFVVSGLLYFTSLKDLIWVNHDFSIQGSVPRYKLLAYEPSYFALLMSPAFIFFFLKTIYVDFKKNIVKMLMVLIPCFFTLSFGFFGVLVLSTVLFLLFVLFKHRTIHRAFLYPAIFLIFAGAASLSFDNVLSNRIGKVLSGEDSSVNGRLTESYYLANKMVQEEDKFFGVGLGQIEIVGEKYIREYYNYPIEEWPVVSLPNATAETLAMYGYPGLVIRFSLVIFLFFKFKVYRNYFNLLFFLFLFVYQLMGSFFTSTAELTLWIIAILPIFKEFQIQSSRNF